MFPEQLTDISGTEYLMMKLIQQRGFCKSALVYLRP